MAEQDGSIKSTVKAVCSISYVSEKLQVSRPSLYKYMDLYDVGKRVNVPLKVLHFFDYLSSNTRTENDTVLYFIKVRNEDEANGPSEILAECITGDDSAMVLFPDTEEPEDVVVEVLVDTSSSLRSSGSTGRSRTGSSLGLTT